MGGLYHLGFFLSRSGCRIWKVDEGQPDHKPYSRLVGLAWSGLTAERLWPVSKS